MEQYPVDFFDDGELFGLQPEEGKFRAVSVAPAVHPCFEDTDRFETPLFSSSAFKNSHAVEIFLSQAKPSVVTESFKCPSKPVFLAKTSFKADVCEFSKLRSMIDNVLSAQPEIEFSFSDCVWTCRYVQTASISEFSVAVFWDHIEKDHYVEVKLLRDEGFRTSLRPLLQALQHAVQGAAVPAPVPASVRRGIRQAPPLVRSSSGSASEMTPSAFLAGIAPVFSLARSSFLDGRLEAAKMLLDLASKSSAFVELPRCVEGSCEALCVLMTDEDSEETRLLALSALEAFLRLPAFISAFCEHASALEALVNVVIHANPSEAPGSGHGRRRAARCLALLAGAQPVSLLRALLSLGLSEVVWLQHTQALQDNETRALALRVADCFSRPVDLPSATAQPARLQSVSSF